MTQGPDTTGRTPDPRTSNAQGTKPGAPASAAPTGTPGVPPTQTSPTSGDNVTEQAQQTATHLMNRAGDMVASRLEAQKGRAVGGLGNVATTLRHTSRAIAEDDPIGFHRYVETAANQVERFSHYLDANDVGDLVDDVENLARRQPALFVGGAFAIGLLAARFLKTSRPGGRSARATTPKPRAAMPRRSYGLDSSISAPSPAAGVSHTISPHVETPERVADDLVTPGVRPGGGREGL